MHKLLLALLVGLLATGLVPKASALKGQGVTTYETIEPVISAEVTSKEYVAPPKPAPPPPQPAPKAPSLSYSRQAIINYIYSKSWNGAIATAIFTCESGLRPTAIGDGGHSIGIAQIYMVAHPGYSVAWLENPYNNIDLAYSIYVGWGRSFRAWTCARILGYA